MNPATRTGPGTARPAEATTRPGAAWMLAAGTVIFAAGIGAYLAAIASHPAATMLKGFDLNVYLHGGLLARHSPGSLYTWQFPGHPNIMFTYSPFAALLFAVVSLVSLRTAEDAAVLAGLLALAATATMALRSLDGAPRTRAGRIGLVLALTGAGLWLEPVQRALFLGQIGLVLMVAVVWDLHQPASAPGKPGARRPGRWWTGIATGLAAGVKLTPLIFIPYLVLTRRYRAAVTASVTFAVTIVAGFALLPSASVHYWLDGAFFQAGRTGFVGVGNNQSLRGLITRLAGSVATGKAEWFPVAVLVMAAGLAAAALLARRGYRFEGLMTCALTGLLISPISWDHHWVWVVPFLAVLLSAGNRARAGLARAAWYAGAALLAAVFAGWPEWWSHRAGLLHGGLIWYAPATPWASGDRPWFYEYHWHGLQLIAGNLYLLAGCCLFLAALGFAWWLLRDRGGLRTVSGTGSPGRGPSRGPARSADIPA